MKADWIRGLPHFGSLGGTKWIDFNMLITNTEVVKPPNVKHWNACKQRSHVYPVRLCVFCNAFRFDLIFPHKKLYSRCNRNPVGSDSRHRKEQSMKPGSRLPSKRGGGPGKIQVTVICLGRQWKDVRISKSDQMIPCSVAFRRKYDHECSSVLSKRACDVSTKTLHESSEVYKLVRIHLEKGSKRD